MYNCSLCQQAYPTCFACLPSLMIPHIRHHTMRFGSTSKVLPKCKLKY